MEIHFYYLIAFNSRFFNLLKIDWFCFTTATLIFIVFKAAKIDNLWNPSATSNLPNGKGLLSVLKTNIGDFLKS